MRCPICDFLRDRFAGTCVDAVRHWLHRDAVVDRANTDTKIAANTLVIDDFEKAFAVYRIRDGLMRGVLANDVATATLDTQVLIDIRFLNIVEIQVFCHS